MLKKKNPRPTSLSLLEQKHAHFLTAPWNAAAASGAVSQVTSQDSETSLWETRAIAQLGEAGFLPLAMPQSCDNGDE